MHTSVGYQILIKDLKLCNVHQDTFGGECHLIQLAELETKKTDNLLVIVDLGGRDGGSLIVLSRPLRRGYEENYE
jgi:hypothetical protein